MKLFRLFLVLTVLIWPGTALAAGADMDSVLNRLQEIGGRIETLSSDFSQEKYLSVFQEMLPAAGRFYYRKPDQLRWELTSPVTSGFVLKGKQGRRWSQAGDAGERFDISREPVMKIVAEQLLAWTRADFDRLRTEYDMRLLKESPVTLRLDPKGGAAGFLDYLQITFAESGGHVQQVEVHEKGGDFTRIIFHGTAINQPVADELF
ncbi:LolA family protein [Geoalkalibacter halelectricus]|uniref:Outer membrane lipoprotein carrier protein LolA n=1 Tax=Geoalkalibacter halelectricus TaxID=2847045 RepID=A0ABY5ZJD6_9BACT|nr:outer membrane lipoprotein carrier protein LolA [Geoalkalibacter halelectricus]MDO3379813.1 outer membrane lipoprotein carrier protein LolA [Geoalkalibacter halelectricus]UWZ79247.1 outer membrane lipoprotein carrier protein LolA [Geoalkalibacter halelectricus]